MLALWEGGSAYSIDAETLTTQGLKTWAPELKHMPFSAHPKIDPRGYMWNFGLAPYHNKTGSLIVYKHKKGASKVDYQLVPLPFAGYLHDFAQTASKLIFYISPYRFSHNKGHTYVQRFSWEPELGGRIIVVDKDDLSKKQIFDAPTGFVFHFGQAQQHDKHINLVASWHRTPEIMATGMYDVLTSDEVNYNKSHASILTINTDTGSVQLSESGHELEFPSFDQYRGGDTVFGVGRKPNSNHHYANSTLAWNSQSGRVDEYFFDDGIIAEEPLYIADTNSSKAGAGWLLQSALNYRDSRTELFVFDAQNIKSGPVAVATMDRSTPLGFHGTFIPV